MGTCSGKPEASAGEKGSEGVSKVRFADTPSVGKSSGSGDAMPMPVAGRARSESRLKPETVTALEEKLREIVKDHSKNPTVKLKTINSILMKFAQLEPAFSKCKELFNSFDENGDGKLQRIEIEHCLPKLGVKGDEAMISDLFATSDLDHHDELNFKEFMIVIALVVLLDLNTEQVNVDDQSSLSPPSHAQIKSAINVVADAFAFFDVDGDGSISKEEVDVALTQSKGGHGGSAAVARFDEMDWDHDGNITFKEFLYAFCDWVLEDEEE